jgi:hypothetical protein
MAGLNVEKGATPGERDGQGEKVWPWHKMWPPPPGSGNFGDESLQKSSGVNSSGIILGYNDGFIYTSPVGSFPSNALGIYDLSGNVHEWVSDDYSNRKLYGVVRGGGWNTASQEKLALAFRHAIEPNKRDNLYGFRVVISKIEKEVSSNQNQ